MNNLIKSAKSLANTFVKRRYKISVITRNNRNVRVKLQAETYKKDLCTFYYSGVSQLAQDIIQIHRENPFNNIDELIGELEIQAGICLDEFAKKIQTNFTTSKITLDDIVTHKIEL